MERLEYESYEEFACEIAGALDSLEGELGDISIIAKYFEAKEIIRELLCLGYGVAGLEIHREDFDEYYDEYRIALNQDGVWCEKFKYEKGYLNDDAPITYIMDNCSSAVLKHIDSEEIYEVCVGEDRVDEADDSENETRNSYMVNGKSVDKETFNKYVSQFAPDLTDTANASKDNNYTIPVECNLNVDEALKIVADMERRIIHMNDMFREMDRFRRLFNW